MTEKRQTARTETCENVIGSRDHGGARDIGWPTRIESNWFSAAAGVWCGAYVGWKTERAHNKVDGGGVETESTAVMALRDGRA